MMTDVIEVATYITGVTFILAGLSWAWWWAVGKIIKMLGYWPLFIKALGVAARERHERRKK